MKVLFLITARGGSKGIPGKNLRRIQGISLVGYKAVSALKSRYCSRLILTTDSPEIQADGRKYGAETPYLRPAELAGDTSRSVDVIAHAMDWIEKSNTGKYDAVMLLEPSSPFARADDYDRAVEIMIEKNANVVLGVREVEVGSVYIGPMDDDNRLTRIVEQVVEQQAGRRQDVRAEYTPNGALYLFKWDFFKEFGAIYHDPRNTFGYVMDRELSIEIDQPLDLAWAEFLVEKGIVDINHWR